MGSARRHVLRAAFLAALLLLPLGFSGHEHAADGGASPACGTCVAIRHTPSLAPAAAPACAPRLVAVAVAPRPAAAPSAVVRARRLGRAPPLRAAVAFV